jgi:hypothetical protein
MSKSKILLLIYYLFILLFVQQLSAQPTQFGIGINITDFLIDHDIINKETIELYGIEKYPVLYMPIIVPPIRIEPEISYWHSSHAADYKERDYKISNKYTLLHLGIGIAPIIKGNSKTISYIGAKIGIDILTINSEKKSEYEDEEKTEHRTNFYIGPCLGIEYLFTSHFSLGGEFQLRYNFIGQEKTTINGKVEDNDIKIFDSLMKTKALVYFRWYF